jgi:hypothetical protein
MALKRQQTPENVGGILKIILSPIAGCNFVPMSLFTFNFPVPSWFKWMVSVTWQLLEDIKIYYFH